MLVIPVGIALVLVLACSLMASALGAGVGVLVVFDLLAFILVVARSLCWLVGIVRCACRPVRRF